MVGKGRYFNRELSWLEFNNRVLEEALDGATPLLERLKFLAIVGSNFDEFYMVRVAALKAAVRKGEGDADSAGYLPSQALAAIAARTGEIIARQYDCLLREVLPALAREGLSIVGPAQWSGSERRWLEAWFAEQIFPLLTPLGTEEGGPFPATGNLRVHAAFSLARQAETEGESLRAGEEGAGESGSERLAIVQVPPNLERFVRLPMEGSGQRLALLDEVVAAFGSRLFPGWSVRERLIFKIARDADAGVDEDRDDDFVAAMEEILVGRQNSWPVRLIVSSDSPDLARRVRLALGLDAADLITVPGPVELRHFMDLAGSESVAGNPAYAKLRYEPWPPVSVFELPEDSSIWEEIAKGDRLLHVPYESFDPVIGFIEAAADDPSVLAIKITLYRTSGNSPVVRALTRAARNGKQVAAIVELKARFDEERNIGWANRLEQAGAVVSYGAARLKVHAKAALVVRREDDGSIRRYLHLSTGNYNDRTARLYADLSLFTANEDLCREASIFFNTLTGYSAVQELRLLASAPFDLKKRLLFLIERETQRSSPEAPGLIMAKLNSLTDIDVIDALYRASAAGVRVMLNVRGVSLLVPGAPGLSENIMVVSVVGRYLEHARIIHFRNGGNEEVYLSSADWMTRNLEKRVELLFPLLEQGTRNRAREILAAYFKDDTKARSLDSKGVWTRKKPVEGPGFSAQESFYRAALRIRKLVDEPPAGELEVRRRLPDQSAGATSFTPRGP
jgi:polyphosphate kinase